MNQQFCTQCGARLPETGAFCPECGTRTQRGALPPAPTVASVAPALRAAIPPTAPRATVPPAAPARSVNAKRSRQHTRRTPFLALSLLAAVVVVGAAVYFLAIRPRQNAVVVEPCVAGEDCAGTAVADVHDGEGIPYPDTPRISVAEAKTLYDAGSALFVDVRDQEAFAEAHVTDSLSIPLAEMESNFQSVTASLPRDAEIITYCT